MYLPATSKVYLFITVDGPDGVDVTAYPPKIALVADDGGEPSGGDWRDATWIDGEAALLVGPGAAEYPPGEYMAWARLEAGVEIPVMCSGRIRVGDTR